MHRSRAPRAFTLVELVIALAIMGVAAAGLAGTLAGDRWLRDMTAANSFVADRTRERIELFAARQCSSDTSGTSVSAWGSERWHAWPSPPIWHLTDSVVLRRSAGPIVVEAHVTCPE
jgi:prepilin-type N-terminal cleavage/methylation domain-containing protein